MSTKGRILVGGDFNARAFEWACFSQTPEGNGFWKWWREPGILSIDQMDHIVRALLPRHPVRVDVNSVESVKSCPLFTMRELEEAVLTMKNEKAPGPDGIPAEVYKLIRLVA